MITDRLELRLGTADAFRVAIVDRQSLARVLGVNVPDSWPVEHYDDGVRDWCLASLAADPQTVWLLRYLILRETNTLIGTCGAFQPDEKSVMIGYSILPEHRRRGYASEAAKALIEFAFAHDEIERVIADTYPELAASIGVMEKCGLTFLGDGDGERVIRYELRRPGC
jgi:RimJ/RimL family protein N-acetyltransferase